jgi:glycine cleavage system H protein
MLRSNLDLRSSFGVRSDKFSAMNVPDGLRYSSDHEWARLDDGKVRVGITDYAQDALGDVVFVQVPDVGAKLAAGDTFGEVESTKSVSELYAPVAGAVVEVNLDLESSPELVNSDPYGNGWILLIEPDDACGAEIGAPDGNHDEDTTGLFPQVGVDVPGPGEVGQLIITRGATAGSKYSLSGAKVQIGRHPDSDIFLDDVTVSRRHAEVTLDGRQYVLSDVGSLNGTYVDGERIESEVLREGAQIQVGKFRLVFVIGVLGGPA